MADNGIPRLSGREFIIMKLLTSTRGKMYGLELVKASDGALKRGTIYVTLGRLEEKGYIKSAPEKLSSGETGPRRLYEPTGVGARVFQAISGAGGSAWLREQMA